VTTHGAARATLLAFRSRGTERVQIAAILDARTCPTCLRHDGRILSIGHALLEQALPCRDCACHLRNDPARAPARAKCRCRYVPLAESSSAAQSLADAKTSEYREQLKARLLSAFAVRR
jgi:hypothetical protein